MSYDKTVERYMIDPAFHTLVDFLEIQIEEMRLTPGEVRDAAMLASIRFEEKHVRPLRWAQEADRG